MRREAGLAYGDFVLADPWVPSLCSEAPGAWSSPSYGRIWPAPTTGVREGRLDGRTTLGWRGVRRGKLLDISKCFPSLGLAETPYRKAGLHDHVVTDAGFGNVDELNGPGRRGEVHGGEGESRVALRDADDPTRDR